MGKKGFMRFLGLFFLLGFGAFAQHASAITLNWGNDGDDNANWANGDLTDSFDIDSSNPGDDVTITIGGDTDDLVSNVNDNTNLTGGIAGNESLFLNANYNSTGSNEIIVTIEFNYTQDVTDVNFFIYDVDLNTGFWVDLISNFEVYRNGVLQTGVFPTLTAGSANTIENAGTSNVQARGTATAGDTTDDGNVFVDFGGAIFDEIRFTWTNEDAALDNQWIGLHNINYNPAPEPSTVLTGMLLFGLIGYQVMQRRKKSVRATPLS
jgi:hypothetical protein